MQKCKNGGFRKPNQVQRAARMEVALRVGRGPPIDRYFNHLIPLIEGENGKVACDSKSKNTSFTRPSELRESCA